MKLQIPTTATKVVLYVIYDGRVLVFTEPDYPHIALQVPGGTVEDGEDVATAARRELFEETGLSDISTLTELDVRDYRFDVKGRACCHRRHHFKVTLATSPPQRWFHTEQASSLGLGPIRFELFWLDLPSAARDLGYGFGPPLTDFAPRLISS